MAGERGNSLLRALDRHAGIPLLVLLGAARRRRRRRARPPEVTRVGFLRTGGIGDAVLLSGVIQDVAAQPGVEVILFTGSANAAVGGIIPGVTRTVALPMTRPMTAIRRLRETPVDILVDTGSWPRIDAVLAATARAGWTVGFRTAGQHRHFAYDAVVDHSSTRHEIDNFRALARAAGFDSSSPPRLTGGDAIPDQLRPSRRYVVCHMWSGGYMGWRKELPAETWATAIDHFVSWGYDVVLTGGKETSAATAAFAAALPHDAAVIRNLAGMLTLSQTLGVLRASALVVSVNTGIMHMAAAADVPVVSLEGPVPVHRWGPIGRRATSVLSRHPEAGHLNLGWEHADSGADTMRAIAATDIIEATRLVLQEQPA